MSRTRSMILAFASCLFLVQSKPGWGQNASSANGPVSTDDRNFLLNAAQSGAHEVEMGMLGLERGTNRDLKIYAQHMLDDHTLSNAEIEALARVKGVTLPNVAKTDPTVVKLSALTGLEFDREFVQQEIDKHLRNLAEFEKEDQSAAADSDIKGFAHSALPKMRAHLDQVKALKL
jgi:putative membrane protein